MTEQEFFQRIRDRYSPAPTWMAHLWDNTALWVALFRLKAWQDLHANQQRNWKGTR